jgi:hypothetical protein
MKSSTHPRTLAVLTFSLVGGSMAFLVGAHAGAALNGHVNGLTLAHDPMPRMEAVAMQRVQAAPVPAVEVANK